MNKKVFLMGSTQTKHIKKLLDSNHIQCIDMNEEKIQNCNGLMKKVFKAIMLLQSNIVYCVGGTYKRDKVMVLARILRKRTIMHWIGTDVLVAMEAVEKGIRLQKSDIELAGSELLVEELDRIGVKACRVPIVPYALDFSLKKMPDRHSVLVYLPKERAEFYGCNIIKELVRKEPDIQFHIVANDGMEELKYDNVKFHGFLNSKEMEKLYEEITILVRYPEHDGMSMMVIEALGMGKHVLYKYKHPYVETPRSESISDIYESFKNIIDKPISVNEDGHNFVAKFYSSENIMKLYNKGHVFD